jgi:hypothetical protein
MIGKLALYLIFFFVSSQSAFALNYYTFSYKIENGESFSFILKKFVKDDAIINSKTPLVSKIKKLNPHITDWSKLTPGTVIKLFISDELMDLEKYKPYQAEVTQKIVEIKEQKTISTYPSGFKASIFYMNSSGTFTQRKGTDVEISFKQNSPITLGVAMSYYPKDKLYSTSLSSYVSMLRSPSNSLTTETVSIPSEVGFNIFEEYRWLKYNVTLYGGPDFEKFSLFNLDGLQYDGQIYVDGVSVTYLTVGAAKSFSLFNKTFFTKISASKSVISTYQNNAPDSATSLSSSPSESYNGYRFLLYFNYKITDKFFIHTLFKYHTMSGPSDLTTVRIGVGIGYILF